MLIKLMGSEHVFRQCQRDWIFLVPLPVFRGFYGSRDLRYTFRLNVWVPEQTFPA